MSTYVNNTLEERTKKLLRLEERTKKLLRCEMEG